MSSAKQKKPVLEQLTEPPLSSETGLDQSPKVPRYELIKRRIGQRILQGQWTAGFVLPAENELASMLQVSVGTVRRALADLTKQGMIVRYPRSGTVVTGRSPQHNLGQFYEYFRLHETGGGMVHSRAKTIDVTIGEAWPEERRALKLDEVGSDQRVIRINRVRIVDGSAIMLDRMVLANHMVSEFPTDPDSVPELLYKFLLERQGIRIAGVRESLSAEPATERDRTYLDIPEDDLTAAVLVIEEVTFDPKDRPIVYAVHRSLTDRFRYINEIR